MLYTRSTPCLFLLLACGHLCAGAQEVSCPIQSTPTDAATRSFNQHDYPRALGQYAAAAKINPDDFQAISGEVRSLLGEGQASAAAGVAESSFAAHPNSATLATALGDVRFRQGRLSEAFDTYQTALKLDPCLARTRYGLYRIFWAESMRGAAYDQLQIANQLEPGNPAIHLAWVVHLPLAARVGEIARLVSSEENIPPDEKEPLKRYEDRLRAILAAKNGGCQLTASSATTTTLPLQYLLGEDSQLSSGLETTTAIPRVVGSQIRIRINPDTTPLYPGLGLDVRLNGKTNARLELDTGAAGIILARDIARKAGLVPITEATISGIGDQRQMSGFWSFVDDLRLGSLEFQHCLVEVSDKHSIVGTDGLIGADVFENYRMQLDFPVLQMTLSPLPARPGDRDINKTSLNTGEVGEATEASSSHYPGRYVGPEMKSWTSFARFGHRILIQGQLKENQPRLFLVDSGSNASILSVAAAKSVGKIHADQQARLTGINGHVKKVYSADHVDIAFAGIRDPLPNVLIMNMDKLSAGSGTEISGILGLDTLMRLTVDIDYRDGLIHLAYDPQHGTNRNVGLTQ